tara:strand:- start:671 stop:2263 length:1593 start_codon:yes stop_codon:yes gene_type:complete
MDSRKAQESTSLHPHPASVINRYFETLMSLTYEHPVLMRDVVYIVGASSLALATAPWWLPKFEMELPVGKAAAVLGGVAGVAVSAFSGFAQHRLFGFPVKDLAHAYAPKKINYKSATAEILLDDQHMPLLRIEATDHFDAGYVEGYLLGDAMMHNLEKTDIIYPMMRLFLGAPHRDSDLKPYFIDILNKIPSIYQKEMLGKVTGYNAWLAKHHPDVERLTYEHYLLLQLLPDLHNYNPFDKNRLPIRLPSFPRELGCTTIALRLGHYTFMTRVLDWPAHGVAGKYFIQVDRKIGGVKRTIDIGLPLLSGALTILNEDGLFVEMNISHGLKPDRPHGMPAVFYNRACAENSRNIAEIESVLDNEKPLSAYHLTACDGHETKSFHFYQSQSVQGEHDIETLHQETDSPQLMVVANHGVRYAHGKPTVTNHRDSEERKQNIHHFYQQQQAQEKFAECIDKQAGHQPLAKEDIAEIKELCLQMARLALVSNCESVLCAMYVYFDDKLVDATAATDNLYAQKQELSEFQRLKIFK